MEAVQCDYCLAHPLLSRYEIRKWELDFEKKTGVSLGNPFYDIEREDIRLLDEGFSIDYIRDNFDSEVIVERDLLGVKYSKKGLIVIIDNNPNIGVIAELTYSFFWRR